MDVFPGAMHDFLLSHAGHQEEFVPQPLFSLASGKELVEFFPFIDFRFFFDITRPVVFSHQTANAIGFQERHQILEFVVHTAG